MGFFDKAKAALGLGPSKPSGEAGSSEESAGEGTASRAEGQAKVARKKDGRPPLKDIPKVASGGSLDDALDAREAGRLDEARAILATLDRGKGLRTLLRAAAALEAHAEDDLRPLLEAVRAAEPPWMVPLQVASAMGLAGKAPDRRKVLLDRARGAGAPAWALAWTMASSTEKDEQRRGMVDLLFADASLARTVAARDAKLEGAEDDRDAIERYASFAHGRDAIGRFGPDAVADLLDKVQAGRP